MNEDTDKRVQKILERHRKLKQEKQPWLDTYQKIGELVMSRKQSFTSERSNGEFLTGQIFDSTAANANHLMASSLIGALWPNGPKSFQIEPPDGMDEQAAGAEEVKQYFAKVTKIVAAAFDNPKAAWLTSLEEYMLDQGAFGISGIGVFATDIEDPNYDPALPVRFVAVDAKKITIDEGSDGFIDTVYIEKEQTVKQLVGEFGIDRVSKQVAEDYHNGRMERKVSTLHAIEPRQDARIGGFGNADMPVASIHIELKTKHILKESGYQEQPVYVTRFWKAMGEKYGRSPAMEAMPDIIEANALRESAIVATEKMLDPPLTVISDGSIGGGTIDTSAGAVNVRYLDGRIGETQSGKVVEPIYTIGEMQSTFERIKELREIISNAFFIDRLLDLNNEQRMTLGEANIRNELRGQSLGTIYARQIAEMFNRCVERVFHILWDKQMLGIPGDSIEAAMLAAQGVVPFVIPNAVLDLMVNGEDSFKVTFISPASRIMRSEELIGIQRTVQFATEIAPVAPDVMDVIDMDVVMRSVQDLTGAPARILKSPQVVAELRQARAQAQQQAAEAQQAASIADAARSAGQAIAAVKS